MLKSNDFFKREGFSLVEAIVAGTIAILVITAATALFLTNSNLISGHFVRSLAKIHYQTVIDQIGSTVRNAYSIGSRLPDTGTVMASSDSIFLFDSLGNKAGGYKRVGTSLREWNGSKFVDFKVGSKNIQLDTGSGKLFSITPSRRRVVLNLNIIGMDGSLRDTVRSNRESFKCRNY